MRTPTFIDNLTAIQSAVRDGAKWEYQSMHSGQWVEAMEQSPEWMMQMANAGWNVRLKPNPCTCAVE